MNDVVHIAERDGLPMTTDVWPFVTVEQTLSIAVLVLKELFGEAVHWKFCPVVDILDLDYRRRQALALTHAILLCESDAEVADAGIVEVLSSANKADIPTRTGRVVFSLAVIAFDRCFTVSTVFCFHGD